MTKTDAQAHRERWVLVADLELEELRATPPATKLRQLAALMDAAPLFVWPDRRAEDDALRDRWNQLRAHDAA